MATNRGTINGVFEPFAKFVKDQLEVRKILLSNPKNFSSDFLTYGNSEEPTLPLDTSFIYNGSKFNLEDRFSFGGDQAFYAYTVEKQCTIRMMSGVDLKETGFTEGKEYDADYALIPGDEGYTGDLGSIEESIMDEVQIFGTTKQSPVGEKYGAKIAERYILESGINISNDYFNLNPSYGNSELNSNPDEDYGIVPVPGIIDAEIRTKSDDGSLREAKINFVCHNRRQLEILEMLYMRPGFIIALEWGWSPYIDNNINRYDNTFSIKRDFFNEEKTKSGEININILNERIKDYKAESGGNYDGFIGTCKNFSYKVRQDGGYDCTTEIIAAGEILENLKVTKVTKSTGKYIPTTESDEVEANDSLLYYLRSIKYNLNKAADQRYIASWFDYNTTTTENDLMSGDPRYLADARESQKQWEQMNTEHGYVGMGCPKQYRGLSLTSISYTVPEYFTCVYGTTSVDVYVSGDITPGWTPKGTTYGYNTDGVILAATDDGSLRYETNPYLISYNQTGTVSENLLNTLLEAPEYILYNKPSPAKKNLKQNIKDELYNVYTFFAPWESNFLDKGGGLKVKPTEENGYSRLNFRGLIEKDATKRTGKFRSEPGDLLPLEEQTIYAPQDGDRSESWVEQANRSAKNIKKKLQSLDNKVEHYTDGFQDIIDLYKHITKQDQLKNADLGIESENKSSQEFSGEGMDPMLGASIIKQTVKYDSTLDDTGYRKNVYIRWDLLVQIINHLSIYKSLQPSDLINSTVSEKKELKKSRTLQYPVVEITYLNPNANAWDNDKDKKRVTNPQDFYLPYSPPYVTSTEPQLELWYPIPLNGDRKDDGYQKDSKGGIVKKLNPGDYHPILGVSLDESVCLMPHQSAFDSLFGELPDDVASIATSEGVDLSAYGGYFRYDSDFKDNKKTKSSVARAFLNEVTSTKLSSNTHIQNRRHSIGMVYFNLEFLLDTYENMRLKSTELDGVAQITLNRNFNLFDYIKTIWDGVNNATAGYYNFNLHTEHEKPNRVRILDMKVSGEPNELYKFDTHGLQSVVREIYYDTKIDNDLASAISIAAQAPNNIQSLDAVSFKAFNKNIKNRFITTSDEEVDVKKRVEQARDDLIEELDEYKRLFNSLGLYTYKLNQGNFESESARLKHTHEKMGLINISTALAYAEELRGLKLSINNKHPLESGEIAGERKPNDGQDGRPYAGFYRPGTTQEDNVIIPLQVNMKLDGIAGVIPLQLFQIEKNRLPFGYQSDSIAFVVKGESHKITSTQDWTVDITGQLVFLNKNENIGSNASHETDIVDYNNIKLPETYTDDDSDTNSDWLRGIMGKHGVKENNYVGSKEGYYFGEINSLRGPANYKINYDGKQISYDPKADIESHLAVLMGSFISIIKDPDNASFMYSNYDVNGITLSSGQQFRLAFPTITQEHFNIRITGGIDLFHAAKFPNSTHNKGRSLDFVPRSGKSGYRFDDTKAKVEKISTEMEQLFEIIAKNYGFTIQRFKAEYAVVGYTGARSGEHFHVQVEPSSLSSKDANFLYLSPA